jgi:hypothetical protein
MTTSSFNVTESRSPLGRAGALALVVAPGLLVLGEVLHPARSTDPARQLAIVSQHSGAWYASHLLLFVGIMFAWPAVAVPGRLARGPQRRLAAVGSTLAFIGIACFAGLLSIGFVVWQMATGTAHRHAMAALFERLFHAPGFALPFEVLPVAFAIGMVLLAVALARSGAVTIWNARCLGVGAVALSLVGLVPGSLFAITASVVFAAGMLPIGLRLVVQESDQDGVPSRSSSARIEGATR